MLARLATKVSSVRERLAAEVDIGSRSARSVRLSLNYMRRVQHGALTCTTMATCLPACKDVRAMIVWSFSAAAPVQ